MTKNNKKFALKWFWLLLFISVVGGVIALLLVHTFLDKLPEKELAKEFLRTNPEIKVYFGEVLSVSSGTAGSRVTYGFDGTRVGYYSFRIGGRKKSGQVVVRWYSEGSGINFKVNSIELHEPGKNPVLIWSSEQRE
ncbi:MAG: hypothetical protein ACYS67_17775 [Planctomycetota bacterium]|jgi:hypothetical protein